MRQAISLARANQTEQWRSMDLITREPRYDARAITDGIEFLQRDESNWKNFFCRNAISPYRLTYEALVASAEHVTTELLAILGQAEPPRISLLPAQHRRQADDVTEDWLRCYERDRST